MYIAPHGCSSLIRAVDENDKGHRRVAPDGAQGQGGASSNPSPSSAAGGTPAQSYEAEARQTRRRLDQDLDSVSVRGDGRAPVSHPTKPWRSILSVQHVMTQLTRILSLLQQHSLIIHFGALRPNAQIQQTLNKDHGSNRPVVP